MLIAPVDLRATVAITGSSRRGFGPEAITYNKMDRLGVVEGWGITWVYFLTGSAAVLWKRMSESGPSPPRVKERTVALIVSLSCVTLEPIHRIAI